MAYPKTHPAQEELVSYRLSFKCNLSTWHHSTSDQEQQIRTKSSCKSTHRPWHFCWESGVIAGLVDRLLLNCEIWIPQLCCYFYSQVTGAAGLYSTVQLLHRPRNSLTFIFMNLERKQEYKEQKTHSGMSFLASNLCWSWIPMKCFLLLQERFSLDSDI